MQKQNITKPNPVQKTNFNKEFLIRRTHFDITTKSAFTAHLTQKNASNNI